MLEISKNFRSRLKGLMFRKDEGPRKYMLLVNCRRVHTLFMRFPIRVYYLDSDFNLLRTEILSPSRLGLKVENCTNILEVSLHKDNGH